MENKAGIDKDVLETMKKTDTDILMALDDDKLTKRLILNCFCEMLSEFKKMKQGVDDLMQTISVCSADKLQSFFKEIQKNVVDEKKRIDVQEKISQSHKKPSKSKSKEEKVLKFPQKDVK